VTAPVRGSLLLLLIVLVCIYLKDNARENLQRDDVAVPVANKGEAAHLNFMKRAIELSQQAAVKGKPFGSVVVYNGKIVGEGISEFQVDDDPTAHAEVQAIRNACRALSKANLTGSVIYASSQPCTICRAFIYLSGVDSVYYCVPQALISAYEAPMRDGKTAKRVSYSQSATPIREFQLMESEASAIIDSYRLISDSVFTSRANLR